MKLMSFLLQSLLAGFIASLIILARSPDTPHTAPIAPLVSFSNSSHEGYASAVQKAAPSVVNIYTAQTVRQSKATNWYDLLLKRLHTKRQVTNLGSGVIVHHNGYILTNRHVVKNAETIQVSLHDGRTTLAQIIGSDSESDLAVLKIALDDLPKIEFGVSETVRVGDIVLAIGNPFGVGQTVTQGIASAVGRNHIGLNNINSFIQTDAAINPGNSGGALINTHGQLIGINTAIYSESGGSHGIGFAIPADTVQHVLDQIITHGQVSRGWLGVEVQRLTPRLAKSLQAPSTQGVVIADTVKRGPAALAGLKAGDIILKIQGETPANPTIAVKQITQIPPGTDVEIEILRQGTRMRSEVTIGTRPRLRKQ